MSPRPVIVLCEGPHDVAFLVRLIECALGASRLKSKVSDLPAPFGEFFVQRLASRNANEARLRGSGPVSPDHVPLLEAVCIASDKSRIWYFVNCCGKDHWNEISQFLKPLVVRAEIQDPMRRLGELAIVFVNDADDATVVVRRSEMIQRYGQLVSSIVPEVGTMLANAFVRSESFGVGNLIFARADAEVGTLEDVVWNLWLAAHHGRRDQAHRLMASFAMDGTEIGPGTPPSRLLKAAITTAGQSECPGYSLAVVLRDTAAIDSDAMRSNATCNTYVQVLRDV